MLLSYYEVYTICLRALTALGLPYGVNEDAAYMITWLELHKFKGIKHLSSISKKFEKYSKKNIKIENLKFDKTINLNQALLLTNGPSLFDYLYEKNNSNQYLEIFLENCVDPIFIIPLVEMLSNKVCFINACWLSEDKKKISINIKNEILFIGKPKSNLNISNNKVLIQFSNNKKDKKKWKKNLDIKNIKYKIDLKNKEKYLKNGLRPDKKHWKILLNLVKLTYVPASHKSRVEGAGGGNDND